MPVKVLSIAAMLSAMVLISGCVSQHKRPYYVCYFGEKHEEKCSLTEVAEDRERVCINLPRTPRFELQDCDAHIKEKKYRFF